MNLKNQSSLEKLGTAALAIPGMVSQVHADAAPTQTEVGYRYSQYQERDLAASDVSSGVTQRYDINVHQFRLLKPINGEYAIESTLDYETMSGASSRGVGAGTNGNPQLIMSGASIDDTRMDLNVTTTRYLDWGTAGVSLGYSDEDDYQAFNLSGQGSYNLDNKLTTLSGGLGFSSDTLEPTQETGFTRPQKEDKFSVDGFFGVAQVIDTESVIQTSLGFQYSDGYLSDPYRSADRRPDTRSAVNMNVRYRRFMEAQDAALHADYRLYVDDWGVNSHTFKLTWQQNIDESLRVAPSIRYYTQSQADFYTPFDTTISTGETSSDYRLSPYGALTFGISAVAKHEDWQLSVNVDRYISDASLAISSVGVENPALLDYTLLSVGFDYSY